MFVVFLHHHPTTHYNVSFTGHICASLSAPVSQHLQQCLGLSRCTKTFVQWLDEHSSVRHLQLPAARSSARWSWGLCDLLLQTWVHQTCVGKGTSHRKGAHMRIPVLAEWEMEVNSLGQKEEIEHGTELSKKKKPGLKQNREGSSSCNFWNI